VLQPGRQQDTSTSAAEQMGREEQLLGLLASESLKLGPMQPRTRSVFRETQMDTHKTASAEDFGAAYSNTGFVNYTYGSATMASNTVTSQRKAMQATQAANASQRMSSTGPVEYKSVFKPRPEQEHVSSMARERRGRIEGSEWALIDTLEVQLCLDERDARARHTIAQQAGQRRALDAQVADAAGRRAQEQAEKDLDKRVAAEELQRHRQDEVARAAAALQRNTTLRNQRLQMLNDSRAVKDAAKAATRAEESAELKRIDLELGYERQQATLKAAKAKAAAEQGRLDYEVAKQAKLQAVVRQKAEDEALMQQTLATLEKQAVDRETKMKTFMDNVAARADNVGKQAVQENKDRQEREARLIVQFDAKKKVDDAAKDAAAAAKQKAQKQDLIYERQMHVANRAAKAAADRAEVLEARREAEELAQAEADAAQRKVAGIKSRAAAHQDFLRGQMTTKERGQVTDDTGMSEAELRLNARLLNQAVHIVGKPTQYSIKF